EPVPRGRRPACYQSEHGNTPGILPESGDGWAAAVDDRPRHIPGATLACPGHGAEPVRVPPAALPEIAHGPRLRHAARWRCGKDPERRPVAPRALGFAAVPTRRGESEWVRPR